MLLVNDYPLLMIALIDDCIIMVMTGIIDDYFVVMIGFN
jgi:hypothetical protein